MRTIRPFGLSGAALAVSLLTSAACDCGSAPDGVVDRCAQSLELPPAVSTDILFVVDNSVSLKEEQAKVVAQLNTFISTLASGPVKNDFQLGVITTGVSQNARACGADEPAQLDRFSLESGRLQFGKDLEGARVSGSTRKILKWNEPDLLQQSQLLVGQGIAGSGQEMGLEAALLAVSGELLSTPLDADPPGNEGLLRAGSRLLVIIVTDEDDCSDPTGTALSISPPCGGACSSDAECGGGQGSYCIPFDASGGQGDRCYVSDCETAEGQAKLRPVADYVAALTSLDDGTGTKRTREVFLAVIGPVDASGGLTRCRAGSDLAYGIGRRYKAAVDLMEGNGLIESICAPDYGVTLRKIAELVNSPQRLDLPRAPPDGHLLQVVVTRGGETRTCLVDEGFDFEPAVGSAPARVTMKGECRLQFGDEIQIKTACAG